MKPRLILAVLVVTSMAGPALACDGQACGDVQVSFEAGCYYGTNHGAKRVKLTLGEGGIGSVSTELDPGEKHRFTFFGKCFGGFVGKTVAVYID